MGSESVKSQVRNVRNVSTIEVTVSRNTPR